ncbi:MAG: plasmid mobilization relaxosome protein MobC [Bacteroidales bacterium]|nr:plasmid mobilization relaxosome protein MobC [Bacteroidales bacterium]
MVDYHLYREMRRAGTNLNQATKAINAIKYRFKLGFEGKEEYRQAVYMTGYAAEKLSWRSKDVHEVAMKILSDYLPNDEDEME